jgi:hypothetical protein
VSHGWVLFGVLWRGWCGGVRHVTAWLGKARYGVAGGREEENMNRIRRRTTCTVPGHGTRCIAVWERGEGAGEHYRSTEERLAMEFEEIAEGWVSPTTVEHWLAELRERAAQRRRTMPDYPDPPE